MKIFTAITLFLAFAINKTDGITLPATGNPPNYDLSKPIVYKMPVVLDEISGIAFSHGNAAMIYAEQDEEGKVFYFRLGDATVSHTKFGKHGDYEDIAICNETVIMLRSDGTFYTFPLKDLSNKETDNTTIQAGLLPPGEYESLYADEASNTLYALCKNCAPDKASKIVTGHLFAVGTGGKLSPKNNFSMDEKPMALLDGAGKLKLKSSALARHPFSNQWYILSSVNKLLVITDAQWKPIQVYPLNPKLFTQPEGIAFDKTGNLYISNEKGAGTSGTILKFLYQKK